MTLDFPTGQIPGQIFVAQNAVSYQWDGSKWTTQLKPSYANTGSNPGLNPPLNPAIGTFWWDSASGQLFTYYNDGTSDQWVEASTVHDNLYIEGGGGGPTVSLGTTIITLPNGTSGRVGESITINAQNNGDATSLTYQWSKVSGSGNVSFAVDTDATTTFTVDAIDTYVLKCEVTATDSNLSGPSTASGNSSAISIAAQYDVVVNIDSNNGNVAYTLSGDATGDNATINLTVGQLLAINNNLGGHPLYIKTAATTGTADQVTTGVTSGQGSTNGTVTWDTGTGSAVSAGTYYYQCGNHSGMGGEIVVS